MKTPNKTPEGKAAFEAGIPVTDCPYPVGSRFRVEWRQGWERANFEANPNKANIPAPSELNKHQAENMR